MVGAKIPVLEIEKLKITEEGRGLIFDNDGTNFLLTGSSPWTGVSSQGVGASRKFFPASGSLGWLKVHYVSGSTYGATGSACYIPIYRNVDTTHP